MENERLSSKCHLPDEVWWEVLSRHPVKSLLRFRCVCKSWLYLISDPKFCREHCKNLKKNRDETHLLVVQSTLLPGNDVMYSCVERCSETFQATALLDLPPLVYQGYWWWVVYSIDGLFMLRGKDHGLENLLVVWNPSIRKFHHIPPLNSSFLHLSIGLGYDPSVKDYKYVKLLYSGRGALKSVEVYTLGERSWKSIQFQGKNCSEWHWDLQHFSKTVYLRDIFYFICTNLNTNVLELVSFDLSSEAFTIIGLPPVFSSPVVECDEMEGPCVLFGNGDSSLTLLDLRWGKVMRAVLQISETETESLSWTWSEPCSLKLNVGRILFIKKNLDLLMCWGEAEISFHPAATDKSSVEMSSYNLETEEEKLLLVEKQGGDAMFQAAYAYSESLFLLI